MTDIPAETVICPCCGLPQEYLLQSPWVSTAVCKHCLSVWYDGASIKDGAEGVRRESRIKQGATL